MESDKEYCVVTEVGVFGSLNIDDPTKKKIKNKKNTEELINETIQENLKNLTENK